MYLKLSKTDPFSASLCILQLCHSPFPSPVTTSLFIPAKRSAHHLGCHKGIAPPPYGGPFGARWPNVSSEALAGCPPRPYCASLWASRRASTASRALTLCPNSRPLRYKYVPRTSQRARVMARIGAPHAAHGLILRLMLRRSFR